MGHSLRFSKLAFGICLATLWVGLLLVGYGLGQAKPTLDELISSGNSSAQEGEYEAAIRAYKQAWMLYNSPDAAYNMAVIYYHELGFWAKAIYYYEEFLTLESEAAEASQVREWLESARLQISPKAAGQSSEQDEPSPALAHIMAAAGDDFCRQGNEYLAQREYEAAIAAYRKALIVNQSAAAGYNLALLYDYDLNYKANAVYYYQRFLGMVSDSSKAPGATTRLEQLKQELRQEQEGVSRGKAYKLRTP